MINNGLLQPGQIVRYEHDLWRVDYVNECRAYLIPMTKRVRIMHDDEGNETRRFEHAARGVNVSPSSVLEIVEDPERERTALELEEAEKELAILRAELEQARAPIVISFVDAPPNNALDDIAEMVSTARGGWRLVPFEGDPPFAREGSLKRAVIRALIMSPGKSTVQVHQMVRAMVGQEKVSSGAVAACLDRFRKAGVVLYAKN